MGIRDDIINMLLAAREEYSIVSAKEKLSEALKLCNDLEPTEVCPETILFKSQIYGELAQEESDRKKRSALWQNAFRPISPKSPYASESIIIEACAALAVDCYQDYFSDMDTFQKDKILVAVQKQLDIVIKKESNQEVRGKLLARKSSILRHRISRQLTKLHEKAYADESLRCAMLAVETHRSAGNLLELALSEWRAADYAKTDEEYKNALERSELYLKDELLSNFEPGVLALALFYRMTSRLYDACIVMSDLAGTAKNRRRFLRNTHIYAEAAIYLWYAGFPEEVANLHLDEARQLLEHAIASGYNYARIIISLAYITSIRDGRETGDTALNELCGESGAISWNKAIDIICNTSSIDLPTHGLALGIDSSATLSRLGTYAYDFLDDQELAEGLYRAALHINSCDVVALTNLARLLIADGNPACLQEADRLLQPAAQFSNRRFRWWRVVRSDLEKKLGTTSRSKPNHPISLDSGHFNKFKNIKKRFHEIEFLSPQDRGYALEKLLHELANLTFKVADKSYRYNRQPGVESQNDGYLEYDVYNYTYECKWHEKPMTKDPIILFTTKLDNPSISGLFISMSGFDNSAILNTRDLAKKQPILLIDGDEMRSVFEGLLNFDALLELKRLQYNKTREPYYKVIPSQETVEAA